MSSCIKILLLFSILLIIIVLYNQNNKNNQNKDTFISERDANVDNDGNMKFNYLINKNYTNNVLNKYYLNDDTKINGKPIVNHPFQKKNSLNLYGNPFNQLSNPGKWGKFNTFSDYIFNTYGVRR